MDPQGQWSCSASIRWPCARSKRCGKVSSGTWFRGPWSFSQSQQTWSMFYSHRGGQRWRETWLDFSAQLVEHLAAHNPLDRVQPVCRPGHSTKTAVLRVLNNILCSADGRDLVLLVLFGVIAAFDTIDHSISLLRLHNEFGFIGSAHRWFWSYHADLSQHVTIHLWSSETTQLTCGVPQSSVLWPILFLMNTTQLRSHGRVWCRSSDVSWW